jgi:3-isopropylmalate/(R)-2-methylmalate dehydratase small subunit
MMQPFTKHTGVVVPLDRINVDTDQMVPKQFCKSASREGYGRILFYDWRYVNGEAPNPDFVMNHPRYRDASVLLTRANFGCGSSREHAAWAVRDCGLRVIVAPSYADIFYNNSIKNGILPVRLSDAQIDELFERVKRHDGYRLTADLREQTVSDEFGFRAGFEIDGFRRECLLHAVDEIGRTLGHSATIAAYEKRRFFLPTLSDAARWLGLLEQPG